MNISNNVLIPFQLIMKSNVSASLKKVSTQVKRAPSCTTNASANKKYIQVL